VPRQIYPVRPAARRVRARQKVDDLECRVDARWRRQLRSIQRELTTVILTYFARQAAELLKQGH